uniref:Endonuclease/exonuclease/phosphatase domain-containing protein n=1 Tax=Cacopsylla melanoneura TaxID=428564 RepID=A0A8D8XFE8_9HEMI
MDEHCERMWLRISLRAYSIYICLIYFTPPLNANSLKSFTDSVMEMTELQGQRLILLGDFNCAEFIDSLPGLEFIPSDNINVSNLHKLCAFHNLSPKNFVRNTTHNRVLDQFFDNLHTFYTSSKKK